jgi:hypothetical protein
VLWSVNARIFDPFCMAILAGYEQAGSTKGLAVRSFSLILQLVLFHGRRHTPLLRICFVSLSLFTKGHSSCTQQDGICIL